jgi:hypothetical protein
MYNKTTIDKIWNKTIKVKTFGSDKERISVLLGILADWEKLPNESIFYMYLNHILFKRSEKNNNNKTMIVFDRATLIFQKE